VKNKDGTEWHEGRPAEGESITKQVKVFPQIVYEQAGANQKKNGKGPCFLGRAPRERKAVRRGSGKAIKGKIGGRLEEGHAKG